MCFVKGSLWEGAGAVGDRGSTRSKGKMLVKMASWVVKSKSFEVTQVPCVAQLRATFLSEEGYRVVDRRGTVRRL